MHKSYLAALKLITNFRIQNAGIFIKLIHSALIDTMKILKMEVQADVISAKI